MSDIARAFALAEHHIEVDQFQRALDVLASVEDTGLEDPAFWFFRCAAQLGLEQYEAAEAEARQGLALDPEHPGLLRLGASALINVGRFIEAEQMLLTMLRLEPNDPEALCAYAELVARAGQFDKSERLIAEAARLDPEARSLPRARFLLAELRGDDEASLQHAHEMVAENPDDAWAHAVVGEKLFQKGQVDAAHDRAQVAAQLDDRISFKLADDFRTMRTWSHWLLWPLRPLQRFGPGKTWAVAVGMLIVSGAVDTRLQTIIAITWVAYVAYSWLVPPLAKWLDRRRMGL